MKQNDRVKYTSREDKETRYLSLTINKVVMEDSGEIKVDAKNSVGEAKTSGKLDVKS